MSALHRTRPFLLALTAAAVISTCPAVAHAAPSTDPAKAPASTAPATKAPTTKAPTTKAPTTKAPSTKAPVFQAPATKAPASKAPASTAPAAPATTAPVTATPAPSTPTAKAQVATAPAAPATTPVTSRPAAEKRVTAMDRGRLEVSNGSAVFRVPLFENAERVLGYVYLGQGRYLASTVVQTADGAGLSFSTANLVPGVIYEAVLYSPGDYGDVRQTFHVVNGQIVPIDQASYGAGIQFQVTVDSPKSSSDTLGLHFSGLEPGATVPLRVFGPDWETLHTVMLVAGPDGTLEPQIALPGGWQPGTRYKIQTNEWYGDETGQWTWYTEVMVNPDGTLTPVGPATRVPAQAGGPGVKDAKADAAKAAVSDDAPTGLPHTGV